MELFGEMPRCKSVYFSVSNNDYTYRRLYLCRTLSYEGTEFEVIEAPLEDKMMDVYKLATKRGKNCCCH